LNTAVGKNALSENSSGNLNCAYGSGSLQYNSTGTENTCMGANTMLGNYYGSFNTAIGSDALRTNQSGNYNTAIGIDAGVGNEFDFSTFIGASITINEYRSNLSVLGYSVLTGQTTDDNQICLGNTAIAQIRAAVTGITAYSDSRYKTNVAANVAGLDFILKLKPVTYNVRPKELHHIWGTPDSLVNKIDHKETEQIRFIGFLAQEVEQAAQESGFNFPGIDVPRNDNEVYSLRYTDFIMPIVKAIQELHVTNTQLLSENKNQQLLVDLLLQQNEALLHQVNLDKTEHQQQINELKILLLELRSEITSAKQIEKLLTTSLPLTKD
jgi:hypothetical protein